MGGFVMSFGIVTGVLLVAACLSAPVLTSLLMLALGNFGFGQFGFIDCLPAGMLLGLLANRAERK